MHTLKSNRWADGSPWNRINRVKKKLKFNVVRAPHKPIEWKNAMCCIHKTPTNQWNKCVRFRRQQPVSHSIEWNSPKKKERRTTTKPRWKERKKIEPKSISTTKNMKEKRLKFVSVPNKFEYRKTTATTKNTTTSTTTTTRQRSGKKIER